MAATSRLTQLRSFRLIGRAGVQKAIALLAQPVEQAKLGFEEIDMALFIGQQFVEQGAADVIAHLVAMLRASI